MIIGIVVVLALILGVGGFLVLGGDDDEEAGNGNGTEEEETTTTQEGADETTTTEEEEDGGGELEFEQISDDTEELFVEVPTDWTDRDGRPIDDPQSGFRGANIQASTDLEAFRDTFDVPGVSYTQIGFTPDANVGLDFLGGFTDPNGGFDQACEVGERTDYEDNLFIGRRQDFSNCAGTGTTYVQIVASLKTSQEFSIEINFQLTADDPPEIGDQIVNTFTVRE
ncbi:MAG: hypothetical protein ACRD29_15340 [Acidimicrobiales bacterium]